MKRLILLSALALIAPELSAQSSIVPGEVTRGELRRGDPRLHDGTYYHDYVFEGRRGETVIVTMDSPSLDTYLYLGMLGRGGYEELERDDDGGSGTNSRLEIDLPETGTYVIRASSLYEATGPYTLTLTGGRVAYDTRGAYDPRANRPRYDDRRDPRDSYDGRDGYVRAGRPVTRYLTASDPTLDGGEHFHLHTYTGRRGERVVITVRSTDFDSYLVLGTPGGRHGVQAALARDDDGGGGRDARIEHTFQYDGDYVIRVNPLLSGTGRYTLEVVSSDYE
jgi:hypothetical protein